MLAYFGQEVYAQCCAWFANREFPNKFNETIVLLNPKKNRPSCMKDLLRIALCNVLYKIMAKVLSNKLKKSITDNNLIAFEFIHYLRNKGRGGSVSYYGGPKLVVISMEFQSIGEHRMSHTYCLRMKYSAIAFISVLLNLPMVGNSTGANADLVYMVSSKPPLLEGCTSAD
ncbi:putative Transposon TX1 [Gossypium australe]|uniref:Putative Transposon TX1 n=1 Tax=Gossypium australe TaxID=47621 RepID=A0A5B6VJ05_9ROSI|nr:putative Transposon TX1 [Gossypium australe]